MFEFFSYSKSFLNQYNQQFQYNQFQFQYNQFQYNQFQYNTVAGAEYHAINKEIKE